MVVKADREKLKVIYPPDGLITLDKNDLEKIYPEKINIINISKNRLTQENKFSISWFIPILKEYKNTLFQILISGLVVQIFGQLILKLKFEIKYFYILLKLE